MNLNEMNDMVEGVVSLGTVLERAADVMTGMIMPVPPVHDDSGENSRRGEDQGYEADYITISVNNVWGGQTTRWAGSNVYHGSISSYERIGYHSGSAHFIAGVLRSGCPVFVYHAGDDNVVHLYRLHRTLRRDQSEAIE